MTGLGKFLVFLNLVFAFAVGIFAVFSYTTRYNYDVSFSQLKKHYDIAQKNAEQFYQDKKKAESDADSRVAAVEAQQRTLRDDIEGFKTQLASAAQKVSAAEARAAQAETAAKAAQVDVARRQADAEKLRETLSAEIMRNTGLVKAEKDMRDRAVGAEIQVKSLTARMAGLEGQLQEAAKVLARVQQNSGASGRTALVSGSNPPPDNVEGLIKTTDQGGLLKLDIGSDSGLAKGHTLEVFRLSSIPSQSKYIGRVRVLDVTPHEAVAQPLGRLYDKPQSGDHVASHIGGA